MKDSFGRTIDYIRVSVTDRCNLRCGYCMPKHGVPSLPHHEVLTLEETLRLCSIFAALGIEKIKVTGGEPLVRRGVTGFIAGLKKLPGVRQVTMTSNGVTLEGLLPELVDAGLDGVNISLDTLNPHTFYNLTGADNYAAVMKAIHATADSGIAVKINCVPLMGINHEELADIAALARSTVRAVRFIELMPVGLGETYAGISPEEVLAILENVYGPLAPYCQPLGNGPAQYYSAQGFQGKIGVIGAVSHCFCESCNRVRLTSDGWLKLCLSHETGVNLKEPLRLGATDGELSRIICEAVAQKPRMHDFAYIGHGARSAETMNHIGG